jgi:hypothetical protein
VKLVDIIMKQRAAGNFSDDVLVCCLYSSFLSCFIYLFVCLFSQAHIGKVTVANLYANIPKGVDSQQSPAFDQILIAAFVSTTAFSFLPFFPLFFFLST